MKKITVFDFYACGMAFERLRNLKIGKPIYDPSNVNIIADAQRYLRHIIEDKNTTVVRFKSCVADAKKILDFLDSLIVRLDKAGIPHMLTESDQQQIERLLYNFEIIFKQECEELETFVVAEKGILSTSVLISRAECSFSTDELKNLSVQAIDDIRKSGRCIAFELTTAAGFHAFRGLESVILDYLGKLNIPEPSNRNMGEYIRLLEGKGVDKKIISTLRMLKDNYRNPLFHPSENLDTGEDIDVFNLSKSAISAILKDMTTKGIL
ncbi:MAG: hypothetical protein WAO02_04555 [Verrucomicrobiia bacterium]